MTRHSLSDINEKTKHGKCSVCGYVKIYRNHTYLNGKKYLSWRCSIIVNQRAKEWVKTEKGRKAVNDRVAKYRERNRELCRERVRNWKEKNPDYNSRRRSRLQNSFVEDIDVQELIRKQQGRCGICNRPLAKGKKFHIDHIVPLSKGGEHSMVNTQITHPICNLQKGKS